MTRGRSIDRTLNPSRALAQQRDYRARKAAKIESLEEEVEILRQDNDRLRAELLEARSGRGGDGRSKAAVIEIRQNLLRALDAVNHLDGDGSLHRIEAQSSIHNHPRDRGKAAISVNLTEPMLEERKPPINQMIINNPSPLISTVQMNRDPPKPKTCNNGPSYSSHITTIQTDSIIPDIPEAMYDDECCGGLFDCSDIPLTEKDQDEEGDNTRVVSHCRTLG